ncbi:transposase family protein [Thermomonas brevis]|uniref:Transposase family protein n=1 Tax=Thermomonas brevis TaxID=215691 RepID=A0A7G9QW34_9GAMM|nr:DDE-type integrase/transposase/recombinase [Thermomonas brevis]QNN47559.1 transposase family protein [Thermomonas brevis]
MRRLAAYACRSAVMHMVIRQRCTRPAVGWRHHRAAYASGPLYIAALVDACSRRVVGWAMDDQLDLTERVLDMLLQPPSEAGLVLHHGRGSQYPGARYRAKAEAAKIQLGINRPGVPG